MGGELYDLGRGRLVGLWMTTVPVRDLEAAVEYYRDVLDLEILVDLRDRNWVEMGWPNAEGRLVLFVPGKDDPRQPGRDTGIVLATDSVFEVHRRLVDEGVNFVVKPERRPPLGMMAVFEDLDGNRFTVLEQAKAAPAPQK
jgi:predicted enzyme related to lactoylglutathione lyase